MRTNHLVYCPNCGVVTREDITTICYTASTCSYCGTRLEDV